MRFLSLVSPCYNEEANIEELYARVTRVMQDELPEYGYELICVDNASTDGTVARLRALCQKDRRLKVIVNNRNFGHIRSSYHAIQQGSGDAVIFLAADLQDPPELIPQFVRKWQEGYKVVLAQRT